jgi:hypothetical protein
MQVKALKTFNSRDYGLVRTGTVLTVSDRYGQQVIKSRLAERHKPKSNEPDNAETPNPDDNRDLGEAPQRKAVEGNGEGSDDGDSDDPETAAETSSERSQESGSTESSEEVPPTAGRDRRSLSPPPARRSQKKTSTSSKAKRS